MRTSCSPSHAPAALARYILPTLLSALLALAPGMVSAANDAEMTLNLVGTDIETAVKAISQISGRNFLIDPRVKGTLNIISGKPVSRELTYQILVSALRLQGFSVVEGKNLTKILPEADAKFHAGAHSAKDGSRGEQVVTQVLAVRYQPAVQLLGVLKPLVGTNQSISADTGSNTLIVTDSADNIARLEKVLASIDIPRGDEPLIVNLRHASAIEIAASLNRLYAGTGTAQGQGSLTAIPDPRSNRVIVRSDNPGQLAKLVPLINEMDKPGAGLGNVRVVYLKHAEAAKVAQTLRAIMSSDASANQGGAGLPATAPNPAAAASPGAQGALLPGSLVQADTASNALIVTAPEPVFNNLRNVIDMLDHRRAQVYIEALIVELSADRAAEFGIQWQDLSGLTSKGTRLFGGTNFGGTGTNIISAAQNIGSVGGGLNIGVAKGTINIPGLGSITNLGLLARFLETETQANILSTPNILTLDNEEAKIVIGKNVPFVTGSYTTTAGNAAVTPFQTYERKDVGLTLKVKPQISEGGVVRVQIYQEASSVQENTASNSAGPTTNKRSLESNVLVDDGNIIALGGLIEDNFNQADERVPVLGDLPYVGNLFRYRNRERKKTNLMIFLRPRIIRDSGGHQALTNERYDRLLGQQNDLAERLRDAYDGQPVPLLPVRPDALAGSEAGPQR